MIGIDSLAPTGSSAAATCSSILSDSNSGLQIVSFAFERNGTGLGTMSDNFGNSLGWTRVGVLNVGSLAIACYVQHSNLLNFSAEPSAAMTFTGSVGTVRCCFLSLVLNGGLGNSSASPNLVRQVATNSGSSGVAANTTFAQPTKPGSLVYTAVGVA